MSVDDIAAQGAEPLFFLDYISIGKLVPEDDRRDRRRRRRRLPPGRVRAARRRDVGAPRRHGAGRVRPRRLRGRCRRARRGAARATCAPATRSSASRARACAATATRSPARALLDRAGRRLDEPAWPGAATRSATSCSRPSVIYAPAMREAARTRRGARVRAHHRWRPPRQPRAGAARRTATRCVRRGTWDEPRIFAEIQARRRRRRRRDGARLQPRRRDAGRRCARRPSKLRWTRFARRATKPGSSERCRRPRSGKYHAASDSGSRASWANRARMLLLWAYGNRSPRAPR